MSFFPHRLAISPNFNTHPVSQTVLLEDTVELVCEITSLPPATIDWTLDGKPVDFGTIQTGNSGECVYYIVVKN